MSTGRNKAFSIANVNALDIDQAVDTMCQYAFILTRGCETPTIDKTKLMAHLVAVVERFDTDQGMARACEATKDFKFPEEVYKRDQSIMDATGSLTAVIEEVQSKGLADRFNADRVKACILRNPTLNIQCCWILQYMVRRSIYQRTSSPRGSQKNLE